MHFKSIKRIDRCFGPLPDITNDIVKRPVTKPIDRYRRNKMRQIDICRFIVVHFADSRDIRQPIPLILRRQAQQSPLFLREPVAKGFGFMIVHIDGMIERERNDLVEVALHIPCFGTYPESRMLRFRVGFPRRTLLFPEEIVLIPSLFDKTQKFTVADQILRGEKVGNIGFMKTVFVIPSVEVILPAFADTHLPSGYGHQHVFRRITALFAHLPGTLFTYHLDRKLTHQYRRGLQMDPLVFNPHQNRPPRRFPGDRKRKRQHIDQSVDQLPHFVTIHPRLGHARPVVVFLIQIIPAHLIHTDRENRLQLRIDPLVDHFGDYQLVDEKNRRMSEVEDQRMP